MSLKKQYLFINKLESLYRTNRSLALTIEKLSQHEPNAFLRGAFKKISEDIKAGSTLAAALERSNVVDEVYCRLIQIGEKSGRLDSVLKQIQELIDNLIQVRRKVLSAAIYPMAVIGVYFVIGNIFFLVIIPMLLNFFTKFGNDPPFFLKAITAIANPFNCCCCGPVLILIAAAGVYMFVTLDAIAYIRGMIFVFVPGFGQLDKLKNMFAYIYTMKICYESGMSIYESADLSTYNVGNEYLAQIFDEVPVHIKNGDTITDAINKTKLFNFEMIDIIRTGEDSGTLDESYVEVIRLINDKINTIVTIMIGLVKPLGLIIGLLFLIAFFVGLGVLIISVLSSALPG
ncbi:MAG: type II secretion system F family protein [Cyanobacteriota bacterium]